MEQILKAAEYRWLDQLGLSPADRRELLDECTFWARLLYAHNPDAFRQYIAMARTPDPDIAPTNHAMSRWLRATLATKQLRTSPCWPGCPERWCTRHYNASGCGRGTRHMIGTEPGNDFPDPTSP